jgi:flap endonuclease-1
MGIRNLNRWIQMVCPNATTSNVLWDTFRGTRVGIDVLSLLYRARIEREPVLESLAALVTHLRAYAIEPVFVFDGKSPREKDGTCSRRRRQRERLPEAEREVRQVSVQDRNEVKQLFYAMGVLSVNAEGEADSLLAFLARRGDLAAIVTADLDFLPRGVEHLLVPTTSYTTCRHYRLSQLLAASELTYAQFVDMCVLMGCDYAPTIPTISYQSAYWLIRGGKTLLEILESQGIRTATAWFRGAAMLRGDDDTWETLLCPRQREKWVSGPPPAEPDSPLLARLRPTGPSHGHGGDGCRRCGGNATGPHDNPERSNGEYE